MMGNSDGHHNVPPFAVKNQYLHISTEVTL